MKINVEDILKGWEAFLQEPEIEHETTIHRAETCSTCENAKPAELPAFINGELIVVQGFKCNLCHCPLSSNTRRKDNKLCLGNKWEI